jgi:hypothetical protein
MRSRQRPYQLIANEDSRAALGISWPALGGQALASAENSSNAQGDVDTYSLRYLRTLRGLGPFTTMLSSEIAHSDGNLLAQVSLSVSRSGRHVSASGSVGAQHSDDGIAASGSLLGNAQIGWSDGELRPEDIEASLRASGDDRSTVLGFDGLHASQYGRLEIGGEKIDYRGGLAGMRAAASYDTNLVVNGSGVAFGGNELAPAAVILNLRGVDGEFDVLVDGQKVMTLRGGGRAVLPLSAYRSYRIQLLDRGTAFVAFDDSPRNVTLYPGTVETLAWDIKSVRIAVGRIRMRETVCSELDNVCTDMQVPLRNAVIQGAWGFGMTDEYGLFQIELLDQTYAIRIPRRNCDVVLPVNATTVNGILRLGDLDCLPTLPGATQGTGQSGATAPAP